jgi:hypothetical protein
MMPMSLKAIRSLQSVRPPGYENDVLSRVRITDGDTVFVSAEDFRELMLKYRPGYGDKLAQLLKPAAKIIDSLLGTDLVNCAGCAERQADLNERFPARL